MAVSFVFFLFCSSNSHREENCVGMLKRPNTSKSHIPETLAETNMEWLKWLCEWHSKVCGNIYIFVVFCRLTMNGKECKVYSAENAFGISNQKKNVSFFVFCGGCDCSLVCYALLEIIYRNIKYVLRVFVFGQFFFRFQDVDTVFARTRKSDCSANCLV